MTMKDQGAPITVRTYDKDGYRQRAAAVCVKDDKQEEVLLVTSKRVDSIKWVIPGGGIEPGENAYDAAVREVFEEAGVKGSIIRMLGVFDNVQCKHRTSVFLLKVAEEFHDWEDARRIGRKRKWFPISEARHLLGMHKESQQAFLDIIIPHCSTPSSSGMITVSSVAASLNSCTADEHLVETNMKGCTSDEHSVEASVNACNTDEHLVAKSCDQENVIGPCTRVVNLPNGTNVDR